MERSTGEAINGAAVELAGSRAVVSNARGEFVIPGVKPGRRRLVVKMIGYRDWQTTLDVQGDLDVRVDLEIEAVRVQGVTATNRTYTIHGKVVDRAKRNPVMDVDVFLGANRRTLTNINGRFKFSKVRVQDAARIEVRAIGMMPAVLLMQADRDTTVEVSLEPDPVGERMLAQQIQRLDTRLNAVPHSVQKIDHAGLMELPGPTLFEIVRMRLAVNQRAGRCVFIDEHRTIDGLEDLKALIPELVERLEIIDRGEMVRVYTRRYVEAMLRKRANPRAILLLSTPMGMQCN